MNHQSDQKLVWRVWGPGVWRSLSRPAFRPQPELRCAVTLGITLCVAISVPNVTSAQVRTKAPDRGTYNPSGGPSTPPPAPTTRGYRSSSVPAVTEETYETTNDLAGENQLVEPVVLQPLPSLARRAGARVHPASGGDQSDAAETRVATSPKLREVRDPRAIRLSQVGSEDSVSQSTGRVGGPLVQAASFERPSGNNDSTPTLHSPQTRRVIGRQLNPNGTRPRVTTRQRETLIHQPLTDAVHAQVVGSGTSGWTGEQWDDSYVVACDGCGGVGCDSCDGLYGGCDGYCDDGCDSCGHYGGHSNASLCFDPCRWFGSVELLLLFRDGDLIPSLVTTSPAGTSGDVAGELPDATTLFGGENFFKDMTAGGRVTLGTWLDNCQSRSLVFRGWTSTESDDAFSAREEINSGGILAVPLTTADAANAALIAFPDSDEDFGRFGSVSASASSNVFGGDISVRQFWTGGLGTTFDIFYGYQYMRLEEDLTLSTSSTKTQDPFPDAIGSNLSTTDMFEAHNEFHGGQIGMAGRYREGCWSFDWLGKLGFGQVRRSAVRRGSSVITTDTPPSSVLDTGLLINDTNSGSFENSTFGWVPEFDMSIGWHKYPRFDVTFGYNIIAMTDAVRLSGVMDPVNTSDTPRTTLVDDTFFMQGIHFGIRHVY
ncbi:BBP7 family outer membrane beta-barrel protein [Rhodopirellula sallentina]|nr:BBP7 family outer membrane beta-barrel protein [Rhodopirellula sallentina]